MRRIRNTSCIYTGKVGAKMPIRKTRPSRRVVKRAYRCDNGPFIGHEFWLASANTLPFTYHSYSGRYVAGKWEPAS